MISKLKKILSNEEGAETLEYVVIVAIILVIGAAAYKSGMSDVISDAFGSIEGAVSTATTG